MEWPEENVLNFIDIYKSKTLIWDPKDKNHFKKNLKEDAWREIGLEMNSSPDLCKKKIICLLASYRREKNKIKISTGKGKGRDDIYVSRWFAYEAFKFLDDRDVPRKGLTTEADEITENETEIEASIAHADQLTPSPQKDQEETDKQRDSMQSTPTTKLNHRGKRKHNDVQSAMMNSAFDILKVAAKKLDKGPPESNEINSFFTYVAAKVNKYSPEAQKAIQHAVFEILMKADRGMFDWPAANSQYPFNWNHAAASGPPQYHNMHMQTQTFRQPEEMFNSGIHSPSERLLANNSNEPSPAPSDSSEFFTNLV